MPVAKEHHVANYQHCNFPTYLIFIRYLGGEGCHLKYYLSMSDIDKEYDDNCPFRDIPSDDIARANKFYGDLFGWKMEKMPGPMEYWMFRTTDSSGKEMVG